MYESIGAARGFGLHSVLQIANNGLRLTPMEASQAVLTWFISHRRSNGIGEKCCESVQQ